MMNVVKFKDVKTLQFYLTITEANMYDMILESSKLTEKYLEMQCKYVVSIK